VRGTLTLLGLGTISVSATKTNVSRGFCPRQVTQKRTGSRPPTYTCKAAKSISAKMWPLPAICECSRKSSADNEGNDVNVYFGERRIFIHIVKKRAFEFSSEIGQIGEVILHSLESIKQIFPILQIRESHPSYAEEAGFELARLSLQDSDIPKESMVYERLPGPNWTRLFRIDQMTFKPLGPKAFDVSITGSLVAFELESMPRYRALSYTWAWPFEVNLTGVSNKNIEISSSITCNDAVLHVTENLFQALCYLGSAGTIGWLWIDAICINQDDEKEKSDLICQMDTIYSNAVEVIGWLGYAHLFTKDLIWATTDFLEKFHKHENFENSGYNWPTDSLHDPSVGLFFNVDDLASCLLSVYFFYNSCRWFKRAWVTQEIVLAKHVRMFCGEFEVSLAGLQTFAMIMERTGWLALIISTAGSSIDKWENRGWLFELLTWKSISKEMSRVLNSNDHIDRRPTLIETEIFSHPPGSPGRYLTCFHHLLLSTANFRCSEPLDHVFSAIGLAGPEYKSTIMPLIGIEYTMKPAEFCLEIARSILSRSKYLDILVSAGIQEHLDGGSDEGLPTWVPNYTSPPRFSAFSRINPRSLDAGLCEENAPSFMVHGRDLVCNGAVFDTIEMFLDLDCFLFKITLLEFCAQFPIMINNRPRLEVLWRTLILDSTFDGTTPAPDDYAASFMAMIARKDGPTLANAQAAGESTEEYFGCLDGWLDTLNAKQVLGDNALTSDEMRKYTGILESVTPHGRKKGPLPHTLKDDVDRTALPYTRSVGQPRGLDRVFKTAKGFMGICRGPCQAGEQVWALRNAHVPFVLRENSVLGSFEVVGTCFILDKMQGEMIRDAEELKTIRLI